MQNGKKLATAALAAFIDREVEAGMRRLKVPSLAALKREKGRYPSTDEAAHWTDNGYEALPAALFKRVRCVELLDAIANDGAVDLELTDKWIAELRETLPGASSRPATRAEIQPVLDCAARFDAECEARRAAIEEQAELSRAAAERLSELRERMQAA